MARRMLHLLCFVALATSLGASGTEGSTLESTSELRPGEEATVQLPARIHIPAKWRVLHPHKAFSVVHVNVSVGPAVKAEYCLHQNESLEPGNCVAWGAKGGFLLKGAPRGETKSPFEPAFLDVTTTSKGSSGKHATVAVTEDFEVRRLVFFVVGHALLLVAPVVSASLPFYYGSGMLFGILLVGIFLAFQMSRLLPVSRKKAWNALIFGSMLGLSTMVWDSLQSVIVGALRNLGLDQGAETLVFPFAVLILLLIGAFLGFWLVRRFVLDPSGNPDAATATFVEWAIKLTGLLMLFLTSNDWVFQILMPLSGAATILGIPFVWRYLRRSPTEPSVSDLSVSDTSEDLEVAPSQESPRTPSPSFDEWHDRKRKARRESVAKDLNIDGTAFPSSYQTPDRKKLHTAREIEDVSAQLTEKFLTELVKSPEFGDWVLSRGADRLQVSPLSTRKNRTPQEIAKTAREGDGIATKLKFW